MLLKTLETDKKCRLRVANQEKAFDNEIMEANIIYIYEMF